MLVEMRCVENGIKAAKILHRKRDNHITVSPYWYQRFNREGPSTIVPEKEKDAEGRSLKGSLRFR